ncbi:MAG: methyltransferase domain-containing protein [Clostridia bacterium]|jgi:SAM-dependent methyltransferase|nr:methyltransferase domain-containing protein [Clostridia bacterium]MBT7121719.1 methyltransferase domain-containing protein [Clostridia bacterium]
MKHIDQEFCLPFDKENPEFWMRIEHLGRYVFAADYARKIGAKSVLDVACSNGYGCRQMAGSGAQILGIDYNASLIDSATALSNAAQITNAAFRCADLNTDPLSDIPTPDLITCFDTLEHLESPADFLSKLSGMQTKNGTLLLSVPKAKFEPTDKAGVPTNTFHLHRFSEADMTDLLTGAGYRIQQNLYQPHTNICMSLHNKACRESGTSKQIALAHFDQSDKSLLFFARMFGIPTTDLNEFSYGVFFVAQKG